MKLSKLKMNPNNPRKIAPHALQKLMDSIERDPDFMVLRPIVYDPETMQVLGGNQRLAALRKLGHKDIPDQWAVPAEDLTPEQKRRFVLADNGQFGEWDFDILEMEWGDLELADWGIELPEMEAPKQEERIQGSLAADFLVPPFTILDTRKGYWQKRKAWWRSLIGDGGESRLGLLAKGEIITKEDVKGSRYNAKKVKPAPSSGGVSLLDPVLAEIAVKWFCLPGGHAIDPFAGDTVFGYVAGFLGYSFTGTEIRQEQAELNAERTKEFACKYICDDGQNILEHAGENTADLLFSCPPYFDLEVYSDLPNDASNQKEYNDFLKILETAFDGAIKALKQDRFAFIVVGDIRDKKGFYRDFPGDIKRIFNARGCQTLNEMILLEKTQSQQWRARRAMEHRKVSKAHQNVLVFFKGESRRVKYIYPKDIEVYYESSDMELSEVD